YTIAPGNHTISVAVSGNENAASGGPFIIFDAFIVPQSVPTITSVDPTAGATIGSTAVTITGSGFVSGASVVFGGTPAVSAAVTGPLYVVVSVFGVSSQTNANDQFMYVAPTAVGPGTYEDTDANVVFSGSWTSFADPGNSGGSARYSGQTGASVALAYSGSAI